MNAAPNFATLLEGFFTRRLMTAAQGQPTHDRVLP